MKQSMNLICFCYCCYLLTSTLSGTFAQRSGCSSLEWRCKNGRCIPSDEKCDGVVNCGDQSDESVEFCLETYCPDYAFKCAYGACVSGKAKCNGVKDCIDNSDESEVLCGTKSGGLSGNCSNENFFQCDSGDCISSDELCDGRKNCPDASDETLKICATVDCPSFSFKCGYGACVSGSAKCNGIKECHDGSDEAKEICEDRIDINPRLPLPSDTTTSTTTRAPSVRDRNSCEVTVGPNMIISPDYDPSLSLQNGDFANDLSSITYKCKTGYTLFGADSNLCWRGSWTYAPPECSKTCQNGAIQGITFDVHCSFNRTTVPCNGPIRSGTIATVTCAIGYKKPDRTVFDTLVCGTHGEWDYHPHSCVPICGQEVVEVKPFASNADPVDITKVPWHAAIYQRGNDGIKHICGGTIISAKLVISAAHCFWSKRVDPTKYLVMVGKIYRDYYAREKLETQEFNISEIHIPIGYLGENAFYHNDIAVLVLNKFIRYQSHIKPACLEWQNYAQKDLRPETSGKIAGWGRVSANGTFSDDLRAITLPVIDRTECIKKVSTKYESFINGEKFCVGSPDGDGAPCQGDSGGGFLVPKDIQGIPTYFLWGLVSTSLSKENCGTEYYVAFTNIQYHELMIREFEARFRPK